MIARIPFYPSLGNHDGNETESRGDLSTLSTTFLSGRRAWTLLPDFVWRISGFFCSRQHRDLLAGSPVPIYLENGDQHKWLEKNLGESKVPWRFRTSTTSPFNAGPRHPAVAKELNHFLELFKKDGVKVVFSGHEHNFQFSAKNGETGDIGYVVSGAGGELRRGDVRGSMQSSQIEGWGGASSLSAGGDNRKETRITPKSFEKHDRRRSFG